MKITNNLPPVGGQAVIEGVMMRSGSTIATVVRNKGGELIKKIETRAPLSKKNRLFGLPIIRGTLNLIDMLSVGITTLNWSAEIAESDAAEKKGDDSAKKKSSSSSWIAVFIAFAVAIGLFVFIPMLASKFFGFEKEAFVFNLVAGAFRMAIFIIYLVAISFLPDVKRVFRYHGAEHKSIHAYEKGDPLTVANAQKYKTLHPRCGTSFLLIVAVLSILFFAVADTIIALVLGFVPNILQRFAIHLALWPLLAGVCYEALKLSARLSEKRRWAKILVFPGLAIQKISTAEPDDSMVEVALVALKEAIGPTKVADLTTKE